VQPRHNALRLAELADLRRRGEAAAAKALLGDFVTAAVADGIPAGPLRMRRPGRRRTVPTDRTGWYIRRDRSLGVTEDGEFVVLTHPVPWQAGLLRRRVMVPVSDPPLVVGRGGRDGDSVDLAELLRLRLAAGAAF
jgi:hypothetical protein